MTNECEQQCDPDSGTLYILTFMFMILAVINQKNIPYVSIFICWESDEQNAYVCTYSTYSMNSKILQEFHGSMFFLSSLNEKKIYFFFFWLLMIFLIHFYTYKYEKFTDLYNCLEKSLKEIVNNLSVVINYNSKFKSKLWILKQI